ncbi:hypothetical protein [Pectobacterium cacticida]|uniref:hypothetical protein n=1 Tax=Pectobacterium cacticida TaxID=69221 RepID=UPI002FF0AB3C
MTMIMYREKINTTVQNTGSDRWWQKAVGLSMAKQAINPIGFPGSESRDLIRM